MSLMELSQCLCTLLERESVPDGQGGQTGTWRDGAQFQAAVSAQSAAEQVIAHQPRPGESYSVATSRAVALRHRQVFRRESDGALFEIISDGNPRRTPPGAGLDMALATAQKLPASPWLPLEGKLSAEQTDEVKDYRNLQRPSVLAATPEAPALRMPTDPSPQGEGMGSGAAEAAGEVST